MSQSLPVDTRRTAALWISGLVLCSSTLLHAQDLGSDAQRQEGAELYGKYCSQCHGDNGDGNGYAKARVKPAPRDFTAGKYKFRTTPSGSLPTDDDIRRVIVQGLPYTSMPGWPQLSPQQVQNIIYHLKTFSADFENPERLAQPITIPEPPASTPESIERGKQVYADQGCAACHGEEGRGSGQSAPTLQDDWGHHIRPADLTQRWTFRGGPTKRDIFRTFSTGLNGTPMPSYADSLAVEDRWDLVNYIVSLGEADDPNYGSLARATFVNQELDLEDPEALFSSSQAVRFPLFGQIVEPGRNFYPSTTSVLVDAVYNRRQIAVRVRWNDMAANQSGSNSPVLEVPLWDEDNPEAGAAAGSDEDSFFGFEESSGEDDFFGEVEEEEAPADDFFSGVEASDEGDDFFGGLEGGDESGGEVTTGAGFSDAVAIQLPAALPSGNRKPYFLFGDSGNAVDLWFVDLARDGVEQYVGRGSSSLELSDADDFEVTSSYEGGQWTTIVKRDLRSAKNVSFAQDQFVPVAFSVWDGFNRERGNKRALSVWMYLYTEPVEQVSLLGPMLRAAGIMLLIEFLAIFLIRRRFSQASAASQVPEDSVPTSS